MLLIGRWIVLLTLFSGAARAETFVAIGYGLRGEKDTSGQTYETHTPAQLLVGYGEFDWEMAFEYTQVKNIDSTPAIDVIATRQEYLISSRVYPFSRENYFLPYLTMGYGIYQDVVETRLLDQWKKNFSVLNWFPMFGVGVWGAVIGPVEAGIEIRAKYSANFDPKIIPEGFVRLGIRF